MKEYSTLIRSILINNGPKLISELQSFHLDPEQIETIYGMAQCGERVCQYQFQGEDAINIEEFNAAGPALFRLHHQKEHTMCTFLAYQGFKSRAGIIKKVAHLQWGLIIFQLLTLI